MKNKITSIIAWVLIAAMLILLVPSLITRLEAEKANKNVTISVLYNDLVKKVSPEKLKENLASYKEIGVDMVSVMEEDLNAYVSAGKLTCIKYNVLLHKYDEESVFTGKVIKERFPEITLDTYVVMVKDEAMKEKLSYHSQQEFHRRSGQCGFRYRRTWVHRFRRADL